MTNQPNYSLHAKRKCIFCGNGVLTNQHIYPKWTHPILSTTDDQLEREIWWTDFDRDGNPERKEIFNRDSPLNLKLKVVCNNCNNGFMSVIESNAKNIGTKLMTGEKFALDSKDQRIIATWISMMSIIIQFGAPKRFVTSQEDRHKFYTNCHIKNNPHPPTNFAIFIAYCDGNQWDVRHLQQHFYTRDFSKPYSYPNRKQNTSVVTCGMKGLFFHCITSEHSDLIKVIHLKGAERIWPFEKSKVIWPTANVYDNDAAWAIARGFSRLIQSSFFGPRWGLEYFQSLDP